MTTYDPAGQTPATTLADALEASYRAEIADLRARLDALTEAVRDYLAAERNAAGARFDRDAYDAAQADQERYDARARLTALLKD